MQEAELGLSFFPMAQHPHHPSWVQGPPARGLEGVGWLPDPLCSEARGLAVEKTPGFVFGLRAEELQNAAFWGLSRAGGLA